MINLLPDNEKKMLDKEYRLRVVVVGLCMLFIAICIGAVLLFPSYILALNKVHEARIATEQGKSDQSRNLITEIQQVNKTISALNPEIKKASVSDIVAIVAKYKSPQNSISGIEFNQTDAHSFRLVVRGNAKTRQSLVTLTEGLRSESVISKVELPVSDLAKETNIGFSLIIEGIL